MPWIAFGSVLWIAVFAALGWTWYQRIVAAESTDPTQAAAAIPDVRPATLAADSTDDSPTSDYGNPDPQSKVTVTWSEQGLPDFELTDSARKTLTRTDLLGKPWIASFVFTRCAGICPRVSTSIQMLSRRYADRDVRFVTFTVDPDYDTPEVLSQYANGLGADLDRWHFVTADKGELYRLINRDFLMPASPAPKPEPGWEIIHTSKVCLVDATGRVIGAYNSLDEVEVARLRRDLDRLLADPPISNPAQ